MKTLLTFIAVLFVLFLFAWKLDFYPTLFFVIFVVGSLFACSLITPDSDEKPQSETTESKKFNTPKFNLPKFEDSGWVLFYVICGWIGLVAMIVFFVQKESTFAFVMLGCSLSCFFAAHVLRLQEKIAFHAEQQTELLEKIYSKNRRR